MLTKEDLLVCQAPPNIKDVSLALYKAFAKEYLIGRIFRYTFTDGSVLNVQFTEWGIYHMLAIQHINGKNYINSFSSHHTFPCSKNKPYFGNNFINILWIKLDNILFRILYPYSNMK